MSEKPLDSPIPSDHVATREDYIGQRRQETLLKTGALQKAIFNSANFSSIATDAQGVIQIFNVGAERMLGYTASDVVNKITPADISDPQEVIARAEALSLELGTQITPGFEALVFKASRGIEDIYELTYIRKDGSRFPAVVSVTALRDVQDFIIGYLLIGTDNTARKQAEQTLLKAEAELERLRTEEALRVSEKRYHTLFESIDEGFCIIEKIEGTAGAPLDFRYIEANAAFGVQTGISDVLGKTIRQVAPDETEEWFLTYDQVLRTGESIRFERGLITQGRVLELHAFRVEGETGDRVAINFKDITERKRTEDLLRRNHDTFFNMIENAPFGVYVVDSQFRVWQNSKASQRAFQNVVPLIGRDFGEVMRILWPEAFAHEAISRFQYTLETGDPYISYDTTEQRLDISVIESYDWRIERITLPDGQFGVVCYYYDMTERKKAQEMLHRSLGDLRDAEVELRATEVALSQEKVALAEHVTKLQQSNQSLEVATYEANIFAKEIASARDKLAHMAQHDALTDLPNRNLLYDRLAQAIALAHRQGKKFAVMFLDLDRFKHINDTLGHAVGDQLLQSVAKRLMAGIRDSDTVCRQGGDEFVLVLTDVEHVEDVEHRAQKILAELTDPYSIEQLEVRITVSVGISLYPDDGQDADTLIQNADTAMYHVKDYGRDDYLFFEQKMHALAIERHSIEADLRRALERLEFMLHYQPKINLESGAISGVEALVRWQHPQRGVVLPEQFVWIAEDCGLIVPIGNWVLREACQQAQTWQDMGLPSIPMAVNISAVQFRQKDFLESLVGILEETGLDPCFLELELTETVLMQDADGMGSVLMELKAMGVRLSIDDFGTGYSSLSYLKRFPIDTLKIDQSFMQDITGAGADSDDAAIITAVLSMAKTLNQGVIAEGVETREQLAFLLAQGCGEGQGSYFSRPVSPEEMFTLLKTGLPLRSRAAGFFE